MELLAPAGNFAMLQTAINTGADAVYFGLKDFSMRSGAKNFKITDLKKIQKICKPNKVKKYLALNIVIYDKEIKKIENIIKKSKKYIDAIICWDMAVIQLCKKYKIPFHISTQASVSNSETAKFYKKLGAERIILARELSLKQIKEISKVKGIQVECFAHGAMCIAVSGRCLTSQFLFNKSANRGECIHPCRRSYEITDLQEGYKLKLKNNKILSAKDLCTLPFIEQLKKSGITVFKIEGRNRDPRYVDTVVKAYRKALDDKLTKQQTNKLIKELKNVYNKEFSTGFYLGLPTSDDFAQMEHSASKIKKHFVGKVIHYYPKINVATIQLVSQLKIGDKIVIIGKTTGVINSEIKSMQIKHKPVKQGKKAQEVGIKIPLVRKNDEVYVLKNE